MGVRQPAAIGTVAGASCECSAGSSFGDNSLRHPGHSVVAEQYGIKNWNLPALFKVLIWAEVLMCVNYGLNIALLARGHERVFVKTALVCLAVNLAGNLLFIPRFSWRAAAVFTIVTELVLLRAEPILVQEAYRPSSETAWSASGHDCLPGRHLRGAVGEDNSRPGNRRGNWADSVSSVSGEVRPAARLSYNVGPRSDGYRVRPHRVFPSNSYPANLEPDISLPAPDSRRNGSERGFACDL